MQGINLEQYFQITGSSYDTLVEQIKPQAEKRIKSRLVLEAVAAKEGIEVSEEEYVKETERMAEIYQMEAEKVREMLGEKEKTEDLSAISKQYDAYMVNRNQPVKVLDPKDTYEGTARGITTRGELLVDTWESRKLVSSGEVSVRGIYGYL